jgi:nitroimidazol reductase NimA-like FMN-containing flavoprotein (pyridoxamine 5'-phosphate oxidase superfamily)
MEGKTGAVRDVRGWAADADALADFLEEPNLCRVATVDEDGAAHVVPAWFWWDGERFWVGAQAGDRKVANVRRTGRATIEVDGDIRRKRGLFAQGLAWVVDGDDGAREYVRITARQVARYQPDKPPNETAEKYGRSGTPVVIVVAPDRIVSWGR